MEISTNHLRGKYVLRSHPRFKEIIERLYYLDIRVKSFDQSSFEAHYKSIINYKYGTDKGITPAMVIRKYSTDKPRLLFGSRYKTSPELEELLKPKYKLTKTVIDETQGITI